MSDQKLDKGAIRQEIRNSLSEEWTGSGNWATCSFDPALCNHYNPPPF